ncbi:ATP-binding cassette domain-containing protein [Streptomyces sp. NPDC012508]|uniref:ATP-binding cassette domain-containing protein n=1 Tax=Streptomyces sp. NPDC012508 TaxID=3364837 RepID=UPI0036804103
MVFQKSNPFPAMTVYDNVTAGLKPTGTRVAASERDALVEECLTKAGLWKEVRDRLRRPGGALSGGRQQRLCIARSPAVRPRILQCAFFLAEQAAPGMIVERGPTEAMFGSPCDQRTADYVEGRFG